MSYIVNSTVSSISAAAPAPGQILTATSSTNAIWQYPAGYNPLNPNQLWDSDVSRPAFAELRFSTTDISVEVTVTGDLSPFTAQQEIAVFVNGTPTTYAIPDGGTTISIPLAAGTTKQIVVRESTKAYALPGCIVTSYFCRGVTVSTPTTPANRLVVLGDSISCGFLCTHPTTEAWSQLIKADGYFDVTCHSHGGDMASGLADTTLAGQLIFDGTNRNVLWIALGYNDFYGQVNPTTVASIYGAFLDQIHALYPSVMCICQSPIAASIETGTTYSLGAYRTAIAGVCTTRSWTQYIDGTTIGTSGQLVDGIHPGTAGNVTYANAVRNILGTSVTVALAEASHSFWLHPDTGRTVAAGKQTAWTDSTGHGYNCISVSHNPSDGTMGNNTPAAVCDGTDYFAQSGAGTSSTSHTWCFLMSEADNTIQQILGSNAGSPETNVSGHQGIYLPGVAHVQITGSSVVLGSQVLCFTLQGGTYTVYRNGVQAGQITGQTACTFSPNTLLGTADGGGSLCMRGDIASVAYCDTFNTDLITAFTAWGRARAGF